MAKSWLWALPPSTRKISKVMAKSLLWVFPPSTRIHADRSDCILTVCHPKTLSRHYSGMAVVAKETQAHARIREYRTQMPIVRLAGKTDSRISERIAFCRVSGWRELTVKAWFKLLGVVSFRGCTGLKPLAKLDKTVFHSPS